MGNLNTAQGFPKFSAPFVDSNTGFILQPWLQLLVTLWQKTNAGQNNGLSVTITTAPLTGGGTHGSMTFVNGILTMQVQAT